jgi:hypothetical protein
MVIIGTVRSWNADNHEGCKLDRDHIPPNEKRLALTQFEQPGNTLSMIAAQ